MDTQKIVENIQNICARHGVKPPVACRESGIGKDVLSNLKSGRTKSIKIEKLRLLADYLGVTTSELLGEKKDGPGAVSDVEAALDQELISRLVRLTPEELEKVDAFVQGLLAAR